MTKKRSNKASKASSTLLIHNDTKSSTSQCISEISKSKSSAAKDPYTISKFTDIPPFIPLASFLRQVSKFIPNIIGISRRADYRNKRLGYTIFIYSVSKNIDTKSIFLVFDGNSNTTCSIVDYEIGCAQIEESCYKNPNECIPTSIFFKGFKKLDTGTEQTELLTQLVDFFEKQGTVTSIRINYDANKRKIKDCGFVTFLSTAAANDIAKDKHQMPEIHGFDTNNFRTEISFGVPMLVDKENAHKMPRGKSIWSNDIEDINILITRHQAPVVHPRGQEKDIYTGEAEPKLSVPLEVPKNNKRKLGSDDENSFIPQLPNESNWNIKRNCWRNGVNGSDHDFALKLIKQR
ncbi:hypothetical protein ACKWTF_015793 [Chironomus riparius]